MMKKVMLAVLVVAFVMAGTRIVATAAPSRKPDTDESGQGPGTRAQDA